MTAFILFLVAIEGFAPTNMRSLSGSQRTSNVNVSFILSDDWKFSRKKRHGYNTFLRFNSLI